MGERKEKEKKIWGERKEKKIGLIRAGLKWAGRVRQGQARGLDWVSKP